jgi:hypothetical protein
MTQRARSTIPSENDPAAPLFGTWRLVSFRSQPVDEPALAQDIFGPHPFGRIIMTEDHYGISYLAKPGRAPATNDAEAAALLRSMLAYTGQFRVEGNEFITTVDGAWSEDWNGTDQVRYFSLDGDTLTFRTPEQMGPLSGKRMVATLVFRRE